MEKRFACSLISFPIFYLHNSGEEVPTNEQINTVDKGKTAELLLEQAQIQQNEAAANISKISDAERQNFEEERSKLYKQIDERVCKCVTVYDNNVKLGIFGYSLALFEKYLL